MYEIVRDCPKISQHASLFQEHFLPAELWVEVLAKLEPVDSANAFQACRNFNKLSTSVNVQYARIKWPAMYSTAERAAGSPLSITQLRTLIRLLLWQDEEAHTTRSVNALNNQSNITARHRGILVGWLIEVCWAWILGDWFSCRAVSLLDKYLTCVNVAEIKSFQLVGICCLRCIMLDSHQRHQHQVTDEQLALNNFAQITDNTYQASEVEATTKWIQEHVPYPDSPAAATFLEYLLSILNLTNTLDSKSTAADTPVTVLAWVLLELSLLDTTCCALPPSRIACAALSMALRTFNHHPHPPALTTACALLPADTIQAQHAISQVQAQQPATCLRHLWRARCGECSMQLTGPSAQAMFTFLGHLIGQPQEIHCYVPGALPEVLSGAGSS